MVKVIGWTKYDPNAYDDPRTDSEDVWDAIVDDIVEHKYCFDGQYHQYGDFGVPVIQFMDGTIAPSLYTQRAWGRLMAMAHDDIDNGTYWSYVDFYYNLPNGKDWEYPKGMYEKGSN